jgi:phycobilisome core linker protein
LSITLITSALNNSSTSSDAKFVCSMVAFVNAAISGCFFGAALPTRATCAAIATTPVMAYDMDGSSEGSLAPRRIKSSSVEKDARAFKVTYIQPSQSRGYTFRELQNVYTVKTVPFSSWYAEQQRIMKMGGKIMKVELISGSKMRSVRLYAAL